ncbi:MBL fold metallo-hydrolase [Nocardiopsis sp. NRRL B-16309]|uniref:MBL fold metallo-hydrolase n=1 Tax=Nocardiopsis sp. NRRL B-16309 TaxID=1519494 RepID=UPI0006AFF114|nr:MBL fold metallo-hydrolase [Nocardiopsis sp. NRRL B-16309]KOX13951.1 Zn-dependent hydrolase [Nocardiopsis sp. NRRL B-16309]
MSGVTTAPVPVRVLGGPTVLIGYGGLGFLTDPTFDTPRDYPVGPGLVLSKTAAPSALPGEIGPIDAVLLSHDEHPDNLDDSGRALLADVPLTLTTRGGADRLGGGARGLAVGESVELERPDGGSVTVTAAPAQHGPDGCEPFTGEVIGFVLTATDLPTVYVSGDNASLDVVREVADRFGPVDTAVLFAGAARTPLFDGALLTLDGARSAEAARILGARRVVPAHADGWAHFSEGRDELEAAFAEAGLSERLTMD